MMLGRMLRTRQKLALFAVISVAGMVGIAGLNAGATTPAKSLSPITVAYGANIDLQGAKVAQLQGYNKKHGLTASFLFTTNGDQQISLLESGQLEFGNLPLVNMIDLEEQGQKVKILPVGDEVSSNPKIATLALLTTPNNGIKSVSQLSGKTIAEASLLGAPQLATDAVLSADGVKPSTVHYVVIPYAQQLTALTSGAVQAAFVSSPFIQPDVAAGAHVLAYPAKYIPGNGAWLIYFCLASFANSHKTIVNDFIAAQAQANKYMNANPRDVQMLAAAAGDIPFVYTARRTVFIDSFPSQAISKWASLISKYLGPLSVPLPPDKTLLWQS